MVLYTVFWPCTVIVLLNLPSGCIWSGDFFVHVEVFEWRVVRATEWGLIASDLHDLQEANNFASGSFGANLVL